MSVEVDRYRWLRENPAFETEAFLSGLTPEEYDAAVDKARMSQLDMAVLDAQNRAFENIRARNQNSRITPP
jgi:hypothetical protein